jgi:hypothetical protein
MPPSPFPVALADFTDAESPSTQMPQPAFPEAVDDRIFAASPAT